MSRFAFLLTLFSGDATRELTYGARKDGSDEMEQMEDSSWDSIVLEPISRAEIEMRNGAGMKQILTIKGPAYLQLTEAPGAIEGMLGAISRGKDPGDALQQALVAATLTE